MFRVIIVEDEYIVRFGIRSMIDWEKLGLTVIGEASNGQEALELMSKEMPDILITDIKMPLMDGIALISEVRKINPYMKILILSNIEDFGYAKEAIRNGVSEYLIKSDMMPRDFEQALLKVKEAIEITSPAGAESQEPAVEPMWKEKLLRELAEGTQREISNLQSTLGYPRSSPFYLLHLDKVATDLGVVEGQAALCKIIESLLQTRELAYEVFPDRQGKMNMLLLLSGMPHWQGQKVSREIAEAILAQFHALYGMGYTIGISAEFRELKELHASYEQAKAAVKYKMFAGSGKVIAYGTDYVPGQSGVTEPIKISTNHIHSMVYAFQAKELQTYLEELFEQLDARKDYDIVQIISLELLIMLTTLWSDVSSDQMSIMQLKKQYFDQLSKLETLGQSKAWFMGAFDALLQHMIQIYNSDRNSIIKATQFIQQYYQQEISLQSIANLVHLSKNYFANLFKKEMGESFLEYLTRIRIEKAKSLLTGELKTADIGHLVGIADPKYFSKVFKKIAGVSPSEYRSRAKG
ncbi:response regulator [Paenibacillus aceris]|uniref:Two-component system response regulator YesN n=1 Tax=Paenibacillus aceris TaxID=869555 RepID=A0ABS4HZZ2_9BACL|nr:response regulator [Paenibacillus aceris]MBP1964233.1 two-component system response regulator YesN [Paenibacillus aceris]NHW36557.1 response regulator [Paenibacillus aceris]